MNLSVCIGMSAQRAVAPNTLFFKYILSILCKNVKVLSSKCTSISKKLLNRFRFCENCKASFHLDRVRRICYNFHNSGTKPGTGPKPGFIFSLQIVERTP